jgi:catechol 2,3-dioxygenase-like lactoylglutathione lyase family enzyme
MIDALDHLVLRASFRAGAVGAYEALLGRKAEDGRLRVGNVGLTIEDHASTAQLSAMVFATASLEKAARLLERRAVPGERKGEQLVLSTEATHGVPITLIERNEAPVPSPLLKSSEAAAISSLDHVVIRSPNPERAVALYAGRLGLDLRLDRSNPHWGSRLLFFRCGDAVVEIGASLDTAVSDAPDRLGGFAWRAPDPEQARARMAAAGLDVSDLRKGRKPGTSVFTVRDAIGGPNLVISATGASGIS